MPIGLSVTPDATAGRVAHITVRDIGNLPVDVTTTTLTFHGKHCTALPVTGVTVRPASFILKPGQVRHVTVHVPAVHGDYGVLFGGKLISAHGDVLIGGIGSQLLNGAADCLHPKTLAHVAAASFPILPVALAVVVVLGIMAGLAFTLRRRRHRPRHS